MSHQGSPLLAWPCNKPFCASKKEGRKKESKGEGERAREVGRDEKRKKETKKNICFSIICIHFNICIQKVQFSVLDFNS